LFSIYQIFIAQVRSLGDSCGFFLKISRTQKIFSGSFPKTISPKIFPGTLTKNFSGKRPVRDFPKMPHRTLNPVPASNLHLMQPTHKKQKLCRSLIKKICANFAEIFTGKIFKIYFGNVFSMENDFLDHAAFTKFFSDQFQEQ
jgi:hypothetical protein